MTKKFLILSLSLFVTLLGVSQEITNEDIWYNGEYYGDYVSGFNSMKNGKHYTSLDRNDNNRTEIVRNGFDPSERSTVLVSSEEIFGKSRRNIEGYSFSEDESKLLIETGSESIYRHSYLADYYIYDLNDKSFEPVNKPKDGKIRLAEFSPNGNKVAYVRGNDLYVYDVNSKEETRITKDGKHNEIINGYPDWVYEEEFGFNKGFYWSPNSDRIAYYKFNESEVKEFYMEYYNDDLYPEPYVFKYPKAGEVNSKVTIHVYDINEKKSRMITTGKETDIYIPRIKWSTNNDGLCIMKLNRHQNYLEFLMTDLSQKSLIIAPQTIYTESSKTYIEINDNLIFLKDGKSFLWNSERDGYNHIYKFEIASNTKKQPVQITAGEWDVVDFYGVDEKNGEIYYSSSQESPLEIHVYKKGISSRVFEKLSTKKGNNSAVFSSTFDYYVMYHSDANTPHFITLHNRKGEEIKVLADNSELKNKLKRLDLPQKEFFTFTNDNGDELNCWMIKPKNFESRKQYPVFVTVYGGPGRNTVEDSWGGMSYMWHQMLAQKGYIVVSCDPRGTMFRGRDFKHSTYMQLGKNETEDFIDFAEYLSGLPYVDGSRIGIQGWSYGGYMSSLCMTKGADHYKAGIAVAPVTNWKWYDTIYTERFMRTPQENNDGYEDNSPINHVEKLKGAYLIVHWLR